MAEVRFEPEKVRRIGLAAIYHGSLSVGNTYLIRNDGKTILHFKKSGTGDCTVTIQTPKAVDDLAVAERTVVIPASSGDKFIGPFPPRVYNDFGSQDLKFTVDEVTGLSVAVLQV